MKLMINQTDYTQRHTHVSISGKRSVCARTLTVPLVVAESDRNFSTPDIPRHAPLAWYDDAGTCLFLGVVVQIKRDSAGLLFTVKAMDYGYYLANNYGWYAFSCTPEAAVQQLANDFGIETGDIAQTGITVTRKFGGSGGAALHKIIDTMYWKASEQNGKRYHIRFWERKLCVVEKPQTSDVVLAPKVNIMRSSHVVDVSNYCNTVEIRDETGAPIRTMGGAEPLAGMLSRPVPQKNGADGASSAETILEDGQGQQTVSVECLGDARLVTGNAVLVHETTSGISGLFWVDSDVHTWKDGQYTAALDLNFRNLMNETSAGSEK